MTTNAFHTVAGNSESPMTRLLAPGSPPPPTLGSENAHPGPGVWAPVLLLLALSALFYLLFMAKATGTWPFGQ